MYTLYNLPPLKDIIELLPIDSPRFIQIPSRSKDFEERTANIASTYVLTEVIRTILCEIFNHTQRTQGNTFLLKDAYGQGKTTFLVFFRLLFYERWRLIVFQTEEVFPEEISLMKYSEGFKR